MTNIEHVEPEPLDVAEMNEAIVPVPDEGISEVVEDYGTVEAAE